MKLSYKNEHGLEFIAKNPDETLSAYYKNRIKEQITDEIQGFIQEVVVELRRLPPGEMVTLRSKPIEVTIERDKEPPDEQR